MTCSSKHSAVKALEAAAPYLEICPSALHSSFRVLRAFGGGTLHHFHSLAYPTRLLRLIRLPQ